MKEVICIRSNDWLGVRSPFSPQGNRKSENLSVIGECLNAAYPVTLNTGQPTKRMSGTSCSTPIAAGIGALILEYSRFVNTNPVPLGDDAVKQLKTCEGMTKVMYECMTSKHHDLNYNEIRPWLLFGNRLPGRNEAGWVTANILIALSQAS